MLLAFALVEAGEPAGIKERPAAGPSLVIGSAQRKVYLVRSRDFVCVCVLSNLLFISTLFVCAFK